MRQQHCAEALRARLKSACFDPTKVLFTSIVAREVEQGMADRCMYD